MAIDPNVREMARVNRDFLGRAVRFISSCGIRQFLDIGSGIPTQRNVHEVAQEAAAGTRVVYAGIDPVAIEHSKTILSESRTVVGAAFEKVCNRSVAAKGTVRARASIERFLDGFDVIEPGLVYIPEWRPYSPEDVPEDPGKLWALVGVGRKP